MKYSYRIEQAIRAAAILHKNQVRKGSAPLPYVTHPYAVAMIVSDYTDDEDTIIASLLHDTIEDTDYTFEELQQDFGPMVRTYVEGITQAPGVDTEEGYESWTQQKKAYVETLKEAPVPSLLVAAADKIHNMRSVIEEYYDNYARFRGDFGGTFNDRIMVYQKISNVLNRRLKNEIIHEFNHVFDEYKDFIQNAQKS